MRWFSPIPWVGSTTVHSVGDPAGLNLWAAQIQVLSSALGTGCHPGHHSSTGFWWGSLGREKTGLTGSGQPLSPGEGVGREDVSASGWQVPGCGPGSSGPARVCVCLESVLRPRGYEEQVKNHHDRWIEAVGKRIMVCILIEKKKKNFTGTFFPAFWTRSPMFSFCTGQGKWGSRFSFSSLLLSGYPGIPWVGFGWVLPDLDWILTWLLLSLALS